MPLVTLSCIVSGSFFKVRFDCPDWHRNIESCSISVRKVSGRNMEEDTIRRVQIEGYHVGHKHSLIVNRYLLYRGGMSNLLFLVELPEACHPMGTEPERALLRIHCQADLDQLLSESVVFTLLSGNIMRFGSN